MITLIAAVATNGVIGNAGRLPWSIPDDLRRFRSLTIGKPVIMGRATFDSIGRPLPERTNIVLTRNSRFSVPGVHRATGAADAVAVAQNLHGVESEICVIGGGEIYREMLPRASKLCITHVHAQPAGDTHFPEIAQDRWQEVFREALPRQENDSADATFIIYEQKR